MGRLSRFALALVCALAALPALASAQGGTTVAGRVTSDAGVPLNSASVFIEGMSIGTLTKEDGRYSFIVPAARATGQQVTITARLIGFRAKSASITLSPGTVTQDFVLPANPLRLGEVIVTGAGTTSAREKLGNVINTVDSSAIRRSNETNIVNAMAGKAPNVNIVSQGGEPGASSYINIRGLKSLTGTGQPLFVVDGVPIDNSVNLAEDPTGGVVSPNRASDIDPADIESVEILKGAAAAAIYGARAGDGVVLITTKSGHAGATRYALHSNYSWDDVNHSIPLQRSFSQGSSPTSPAFCSGEDCSLTSSSYGPRLEQDSIVAAFTNGTCDATCAQGKFNTMYPNGIQTFDHFNELFHTGHVFDNTLTASGGNDRTTFYMSAGRTDQNGTIIGPNNWYNRSTVRLKANHRLLDRLNIGGNFAYVDARGAFTQKGSNVSGLLLGSLRTTPAFSNFPYLDPDTHLHRSYRFPEPSAASGQAGRGYDNPVFVVYEDKNDGNTNRAYGNINADYEPTDWLKFNYALGADYYTDYRLDGLAPTSSGFSTGEVFRSDFTNLQVDHNLVATLSHTFSPNIAGTLTLGQNLNARRYTENDVNGQELLAPLPFSLQNTVSTAPLFERKFTIHTESYFGQATVDLYNQLFLTGSLRNDGFSTFGESNQRAWYPKVSAAWTFTNALGNTEQKGLLSFGKLRASYGEAGVEPDPYQTETLLVAGGQFGTGYGDVQNATQGSNGGLFTSSTIGNNALKPVRVEETEVGVDLGFFDQKADLGLTYYFDNSKDVILPVTIAPSSGFSLLVANAAHLRNLGYEMTLNVRPYTTTNFAWDFGLQWAKNNGKVLDLAGAQFVENVNQFAGTFTGAVGASSLGYPILTLRGNDFVRCGRGLVDIADNNGANIPDVDAACNGAPNGALYIDATGFPVVDPTDRVIADPEPHWTGSIRTSLRYKKWQISGLVDHKQGGQVWDGTRGALYQFGTHKDTEIRGGTFVFGPATDAAPSYPFFGGGAVAGPGAGTPVVIDAGSWFQSNGSGFGPVATPFIEDGTYTKLREISVAYTFDQPWVSRTLSLSSIDLRLSGRNLKTWTDYRGIDPEANLGGAAVAFQGIDYFNNPQTRSIVVSVGLNR